MKKLILISFIFSALLPQACFAGMMTKFLPLNRVLVIMSNGLAGQTDDDDAEILYKGLNVPEQNSDGKTGKKIVLENKNMVLLCVLQKTGGYTCNLNLAKTENSLIKPSEKMFQYQLTGSAAESVHPLFHSDEHDQFQFVSSNGHLQISSSTDLFLIHYQE